MMVVFGIEVKDDKAVGRIMEVRNRLLIEDLFKNPFNGSIVSRGPRFFVVSLEPVYPKVYWYSLIPFVLSMMFYPHWASKALFFIAFLMVATVIFWSRWFYFMLFYHITKGKVKYVSTQETLKRVI